MHWGRCLSYGEGITYWPVTEIVRDAAGITSDDDAEEVAQKLGLLLETLPTDNRDELRTMAASLSNLLGAASTPEGTYSTEEIGQAELHWGIRRFLELKAAATAPRARVRGPPLGRADVARAHPLAAPEHGPDPRPRNRATRAR